MAPHHKDFLLAQIAVFQQVNDGFGHFRRAVSGSFGSGRYLVEQPLPKASVVYVDNAIHFRTFTINDGMAHGLGGGEDGTMTMHRVFFNLKIRDSGEMGGA